MCSIWATIPHAAHNHGRTDNSPCPTIHSRPPVRSLPPRGCGSSPVLSPGNLSSDLYSLRQTFFSFKSDMDSENEVLQLFLHCSQAERQGTVVLCRGRALGSDKSQWLIGSAWLTNNNTDLSLLTTFRNPAVRPPSRRVRATAGAILLKQAIGWHREVCCSSTNGHLSNFSVVSTTPQSKPSPAAPSSSAGAKDAGAASADGRKVRT